MKLPRLLSTVFVLGCALLASVSLAQAQMKVVPLTMDSVNKLTKFIATANSDPATESALEDISKDETVSTAMMTGGSINDAVKTKYPKAAAAFKSAGMTADDYFTMVISLGLASTGMTDGTSDTVVAKANVEFFNANKSKIEDILSKLK